MRVPGGAAGNRAGRKKPAGRPDLQGIGEANDLTRTRGGPTLSHGDPDPLERSVGAPFHRNRSFEHARAWGGFGIDILP